MIPDNLDFWELKGKRCIITLVLERLEENVRFHDLRHTNASFLLSLGVDFKTIQERLGHSDINKTLNIYSHVSMEMQKDAVNKLNKTLLGGKMVAK